MTDQSVPERSDRGDVRKGSLTAEQVTEYTNALTRHYGEPVRPVHQYCKALEDFVGALIENDADGPYSPEVGAAVRAHGPAILTFAWKSNLLYRLIYLGQPLRTEKCPKHDGQWQGYEWSHPCECNVGYDVTGWLP